ncbi:MAG: crotonase/enoyl-CoA hydratase family protein [Gammaproteobacteria bacterium]
MIISSARVHDAVPAPSQLTHHYDAEWRTLWCRMHASPRPCFTPQLLRESRQLQKELIQHARTDNNEQVDYLVLASAADGIFNLGGDLALFLELIRQQDRRELQTYATACIDICYQQASNLEQTLTTIALVQGDALGGGFEAALSCSALIAERQAQMGLPEILFNLFPGMGAYSFLARKLDPVRAERLILSGKIYSAEELFDMGVVDVLAEPGEGEQAVYDYLRRRNRASKGYAAIQRVRDLYQPLRYEELAAIVDVWVDTALSLDEKDLRVIERLLKAQTRRCQVSTAQRVANIEQHRPVPAFFKPTALAAL